MRRDSRGGRRNGRGVAGLVVAVALTGAAAGGCSGDDGAAPDTTTGTTVAAPTTTTTEAPLDAGERVYVYEPAVGDCFDRRTLSEEEGGDEIVLLLDCELPHEVEVFAVLTIEESAVPTTTTSTAPTTTAPPTTESTPTTTPTLDGSTTSTTRDLDEAISVDPEEGSGSTEASGWPGEDALDRYARRACAAAFDPWAGIPYELSVLEIGWIVPDEDAWDDGDRTLVCTALPPSSTGEAPARMSGSMAGAGR